MTIPASQDPSLGFVPGILIGNPHYQADQLPG
jgi:hypothetical protein